MSQSSHRSAVQPAARTAKRPSQPPGVPDERHIHVGNALALAAGADVVEVYVGWPQEPVRVTSRHRDGDAQDWATAGALLRERVARAIRPLLDAGWRIDGSPVAAMRWDTSYAAVGQVYDGCWVRMRTA